MNSPAPFTTEQLQSYLFKMLKGVKDQPTLEAFLKEMGHFHYYVDVELRMKRRGYEPYSFHQYEWNPLKVTYLISDGASTGKALYTNLYKLFTIRVRGSTGMNLKDNEIYGCEDAMHSAKNDAVRVLAGA